MSMVGALAAVLAMFAVEVGPRATAAATGPTPLLVAEVPPIPVPGGTYVAGLLDALSCECPSAAKDRARDGMSFHDLRPTDLSRQTTFPIVAGRF